MYENQIKKVNLVWKTFQIL